MFATKLNRNIKLITKLQPQILNYTTLPVANKKLDTSEYTETAEYPAIEDVSREARAKRKNDLWYKQIEKLGTVEEKLIKINMPRYYGYKTIMMDEKKLRYNSLPFVQHATETVFSQVDDDRLPKYYSKYDEKIDSFVQSIKSDVENAILFEYIEYKRDLENNRANLTPEEAHNEMSNAIVAQINRVMMNALMADNSHLGESEIDLNPRHEAFWFVDGIMPPKNVKTYREKRPWLEHEVDKPVLRAVQYTGKPFISLRHADPLEPIVAMVEQTRKDVPRYEFEPQTLGYITSHRHGTTVPGFWPGSMHEHSLLTYQTRSFIPRHNTSKEFVAYKQSLLHVLGIQSSFAMLHGISCYHGFSTFNDLTYPLTTQTIVSDGKKWSFYVYQLNTNRTGNNELPGAPNLCWGTNEIKLFEEIRDDKLIGFNEDVLKNIIGFYINTPQKRSIDMKPYLNKGEEKIADIANDERREFLEQTYKHLVSNRPRHLPTYEVYNWEKIYKIDHNTRPMNPKRRPFELDINPYRRQLDEHTPVYIPKALRPEGPKSRKMWKKAYYP